MFIGRKEAVYKVDQPPERSSIPVVTHNLSLRLNTPCALVHNDAQRLAIKP